MDINVTITNARKQFWDTRKYSYAKNPRPDFGVLLLIKGRMDYMFENNLFELGPCDLIFLPQNSKYEVYIHTDEGPVENLLVNFIVREEDLQEIPITPFLKVNDSAGFFLPILEKIIEAYQHGGNQMLLAKSQLFFCIYQLILASNKHKSDDDVIEDIYTYFKEEAESDALDVVMEDLGDDYDEMEVRLVRIKFLCEVAN